ncbi:MAG: PQQ-binding-like beta-propeller repeat protein [Gemmataceae bacterium]
MRRVASFVFLVIAGVACADDWPQWMGPQRDDVWRETGILEKFPEGGPKFLWRTPIAGGYAGPAVANGRVFVTDFVTKTGKPAEGERLPSKNEGKERVLCLDKSTGKENWKHEYDCTYAVSYPCGPRCTPTVDGDRVYTLGTEGNLICLNVADGKVVWSKELKKDYKTKTPIWGFTGHPLVDGDKLFCLVGGDGSVVVCFDKMTGQEKWKALSAQQPGYSPPTMVNTPAGRQLVLWHAESVNGLDPETGKVFWTVDLKPNYGMSIMGPQQAGDYLFVGGYNAAVVLKLAADKPAVSEVYRGKKDTSVYPINMTPLIDGDYIYGVDQPGQLRCVELKTGKRLWETTVPTTGAKPAGSGTAFLVKNGDRYFIFSESGDLIIAKLSPKGYDEVSRWKMLDQTGSAFGRAVVWSHPAFANKCVFARNDKEIVCVSLAAQ